PSLAGGHRVYRGPGDNASAGSDRPEFLGVDAPVRLGVLVALDGRIWGCLVGVHLSSRSDRKSPYPSGRLLKARRRLATAAASRAGSASRAPRFPTGRSGPPARRRVPCPAGQSPLASSASRPTGPAGATCPIGR